MTRSIQKRQKKIRKKPFNQWHEGSPHYWPAWLRDKNRQKADKRELNDNTNFR